MKDVDLDAALPPSHLSPRFRRWLAVLVGVTALSAALLSWVESESGRQEERAFVQASRGGLEIFVRLAAAGPRTQFIADAQRRALLVGAGGVAGVIAAPRGEPFRIAQARSAAEERASRQLIEIATRMGGIPDDGAPLDPAARKAVATELDELGPIVRRQNGAVDRADRYGTRQQRSLFALGLVAIAASLLGLAGLMGDARAGRISLVTAASALLFALVVAASAFVG